MVVHRRIDPPWMMMVPVVRHAMAAQAYLGQVCTGGMMVHSPPVGL